VEASQEKRDKCIELTKDISYDKLVYIDEGVIDIGICKDRGYGLKSKKLTGKKSGKYYERTNIIAGLDVNKAIAPMVFNGRCDRALFESWIEQFLIKELKSGQVVIMDNASFHKSQKAQELIESVGCRVIFLPPYSPDLSPIEKFWANMKRWIKNKITDSLHLFDFLAILTLINLLYNRLKKGQENG
jgi:transposase